ncbi:MAG: site-specific integrase [Anaerolineae bacterium]
MDETASLQPYNQKARELIELARDYADNADAPNTTRTYESNWNEFRAFCARFHATPLPASPATVVAHIAELAEAGYKTNTLKTKLAAIRHYHNLERVEDPTQDPAVKQTLKGIRRKHPAAPERKAGIEEADMRLMLAAQPDDIRGARNRAILLVGYACALRRSEIVALDRQSIRFRRDRVIVHIAQSKTDKSGEGYDIHVPAAADQRMCAVHALKTWLVVSKIADGPLFRKIDQWGHVWEHRLTDQVVADIVKQSAVAAEIDPTLVSGHSLRRGAITNAASKQHEAKDIRKLSRHKSEIMLDVYIQESADAQMRVIGDNLGGTRRAQ